MTQAIEDFENDDGMKDLWRSAIMKFYSRVLGGRDYSLLETVHFGLRLPATISSFGSVRPVSISDWTVVKQGDALSAAQPGHRATYKTKREMFDLRRCLERPKTVSEDDLKNLSVYAFWRLFDVNKNRLVRKQKEQFVALTGVGWPKHAAQGHAQHSEYARRTLLAYMPCEGLQGTNFILNYVSEHCRNSWRLALFKFVMDPLNRWCPTWIRRNYEMENDLISGLPNLSLPAPPEDADGSSSETPEDNTAASTKDARIPHLRLYKKKFIFEESGEPGEDHAQEAEDPNPYFNADDHWEAGSAWQRHSSLGPNV